MTEYSKEIIKAERDRLQQVVGEYKGEKMMIKSFGKQSLLAVVDAEFLSALLKNEKQETFKVPKLFVVWMERNSRQENKLATFENLISTAYKNTFGKYTNLHRYIVENPLKISVLSDVYINGADHYVLKEYKIALPGFVSENGQQYLTLQNGNYFACATNARLKQTFYEDELDSVPEYYRQFAKEVNYKNE